MDVDEGQLAPQGERSATAGYLRCARCGVTFLPGRTDKRFCSDRCRAAASRDRQASKVRRMEALIGELARLAGRGEV
jgi:predicted nucleic acid-binding Zn ribbon protein